MPIEIRRGFWSRRTLLRFAGWGTLLALVGQWLAGFGVFFWPKKVGAFGGEIFGGAVSDFQVGDVKMIQEAKCYVSRVPEGILALVEVPASRLYRAVEAGRSDDGHPRPKGRFNCPCHGSMYDRYGNIIAGTGPRPMDLFRSTIRDGKVYIDTNPTAAEQRTRDQVKNDPTSV